MNRDSVTLWRQDDVTKVLFSRLLERQEEALTDMINFPMDVADMQSKYYHQQGLLKGISLVLDGVLLEEDEDENV